MDDNPLVNIMIWIIAGGILVVVMAWAITNACSKKPKSKPQDDADADVDMKNEYEIY
jgi:small neutral amino acid transporter SnatA (MarC family)